MNFRLFCGVSANMLLFICFIITLVPDLQAVDPKTSSDSAQLNFEKLGGIASGEGDIDVMEGFPSTETFFNEYVLKSKPLKMTGTAKLSKALDLWTDEYFLSDEVPSGIAVSLETVKKESRKQDVIDMEFKDFVRSYQKSGKYMVNSVPKFFQKHVVVPGPLQCEQISSDMLVEAIMWMSNGGTTSVLHTDSVENINCMFSGTKQFILIDHHKYLDKVHLDHAEGSYSSVDVDRVDLDKYPGFADVEYQHVNISAGECIYLPYKWIHYVRSFNRNVAVNVWWAHHRNQDIDLKKCQNTFDPDLTLDKVTFTDFSVMLDSIEEIKQFFNIAIKKEKANLQTFVDNTIGAVEETGINTEGLTMEIMHEVFNLLDYNQDGFLSSGDLEKVTDENWTLVQTEVKRLYFELQKAEVGATEQSERPVGDEEEFPTDTDEFCAQYPGACAEFPGFPGEERDIPPHPLSGLADDPEQIEEPFDGEQPKHSETDAEGFPTDDDEFCAQYPGACAEFPGFPGEERDIPPHPLSGLADDPEITEEPVGAEQPEHSEIDAEGFPTDTDEFCAQYPGACAEFPGFPGEERDIPPHPLSGLAEQNEESAGDAKDFPTESEAMSSEDKTENDLPDLKTADSKDTLDDKDTLNKKDEL